MCYRKALVCLKSVKLYFNFLPLQIIYEVLKFNTKCLVPKDGHILLVLYRETSCVYGPFLQSSISHAGLLMADISKECLFLSLCFCVTLLSPSPSE